MYWDCLIALHVPTHLIFKTISSKGKRQLIYREAEECAQGHVASGRFRPSLIRSKVHAL